MLRRRYLKIAEIRKISATSFMGTFLTLEDRVISLQKNTACEKVMLLNLFNYYVDLLILITLFFLNIMFPVNVIMYNTYYIKNCVYYKVVEMSLF